MSHPLKISKEYKEGKKRILKDTKKRLMNCFTSFADTFVDQVI